MLRHLAAVTCHPACTEPAHSPHELVALQAGADALEQLQAGHGCPVTVTGLDHGDGKCVLSRGHAGDHLTRQEIDHTRDRLEAAREQVLWLQKENADLRVAAAERNALRVIEAQERALNREQDQALQATRDRLAEVEVYAAELRDLLEQLGDADIWSDGQLAELDPKVQAVLQADGPARGRKVLDEVQRLQRVVEAARFVDADAPDPWRSKSDAANQLRRALAALDPEPQRQPRP